MRTRKLQLKVFNETTNRIEWTFLCDIGSKLYLTFLEKTGVSKEEFADYVADWFKQDFGIDLTMTTKRDTAILKAVVKEKYRVIYTYIYNNIGADESAWLRVWLSQKIEEGLKNV